MTQPTILVADDHPLFRDALKLAISKASPGAQVLEAGTIAEAIAAARASGSVNLVLLDLKMPDSNGFAGLAQVRAEVPNAPVIVVSAADQAEAATRARDYGASGFLNKAASLSDIADAVRRGLDGTVEVNGWAAEAETAPDLDGMARRIALLTPAQLRVLMGLLEGRLNKQIAYDMSISEATVKAHMTAVFRKLNVRNRTQAVLAARALELELATA